MFDDKPFSDSSGNSDIRFFCFSWSIDHAAHNRNFDIKRNICNHVLDLVGKSEEDLLRIDGIGAKAIEELRDGLEAHDLLYILENNDDVADEEDLSQLLQMVFSPDGPDDILLGTSAPTHHADADEELLGAPIDDKKAPANGAINEDMASLDELLNQLVDTDDAEEAKDNDEE